MTQPQTAKTADRYERLASSYKGKRVLVTGGAGFVGSNLADTLLQLGAQVTVLDDFTTGRRELLPAGLTRLVQDSVERLDLVQELKAGSDYVFHLAARVLASSTNDIVADCAVNIGGTLNVLLAARDLGPAAPPVVYTSTSSVYGNPRSLPISEDERTNILSPYASSKFAAESYCNAFVEMHNLRVTIVRYSNVYGPNQSPKNPYCGVISKFLKACKNQTPMQIHGSGMQTRDFTYIDDAVAATLLAGVTPKGVGEVFNIGSGVETTVRDLAKLCAEASQTECRIEYIDRRDIDNVQRRVLNIEKARRTLRWIPETSLDRGLQQTMDWIRTAE